MGALGGILLVIGARLRFLSSHSIVDAFICGLGVLAGIGTAVFHIFIGEQLRVQARK